MKICLCLACLLLACMCATGNENWPPPTGGESTGGLATVALSPSDLGNQWARHIVLLFDAQANPPEIFSLNTNSLRRGLPRPLTESEVQESVSKQREQKRQFFTSSLAGIGAEAQIMLEYSYHELDPGFSMTIYRFQTPAAADSQWGIRHRRDEFHVATVGGDEVIYTKKGQVFPGGVEASKPSVELRQGSFIVMVAPGVPKQGDPGLNLVRKQIAKIIQHGKPAAPSNAALPNR